MGLAHSGVLQAQVSAAHHNCAWAGKGEAVALLSVLMICKAGSTTNSCQNAYCRGNSVFHPNDILDHPGRCRRLPARSLALSDTPDSTCSSDTLRPAVAPVLGQIPRDQSQGPSRSRVGTNEARWPNVVKAVLLPDFCFYGMLSWCEAMSGYQTAQGLPKKQQRAVLGRGNKIWCRSCSGPLPVMLSLFNHVVLHGCTRAHEHAMIKGFPSAKPFQVTYHQPADLWIVVVGGKAHSAPAAQGTPLPLAHKTPGKKHGSEQTTVSRTKLKMTAFTVSCNVVYFTWRQVSQARKLFP